MLPFTNIKTEQVGKKVAVSRNAYLFSDTVGVKASANIYSLMQTAIANGHEPHKYLTVVLTELPQATTRAELEALLPWNLTPQMVLDKFHPYPTP